MPDVSASGREQQLAEIEDLIRTMPPRATILPHSPENSAWFGRALAAIENWDPVKGFQAATYLPEIMRPVPQAANVGVQKLTILLHQARHDLLAQIPGAGNVAVAGVWCSITLTRFARSSNSQSWICSSWIHT